MSEVLQANIFFFIASLATVVFCIVITMILFQVYKITKAVRSILDRIDSASEVVAGDVAHVRKLITTGGLVSTVLSFVFGSRQKAKRSKKTTEEER